MNKTPPPHHNWVPTEDGSYTLFSEKFQEACHSTTGAKAETTLHYIEGCKILEKASKERVTILEIGFGLGIGLLTTLEALKEKQFKFISVEIDEDLIEWFRVQNLEHPILKNLNWKTEKDLKFLELKTPAHEIIILCGDARITLPAFTKTHSVKWNAIYQDAFSPKRNPVLWTKEWFILLKEYAAPDVILSTYSASTSIRKSLHETGWKISKGEKFGPKRTSTRASLLGETDAEILLQMERSPVSALSDDNIKPLNLE